MTELSTLDGIVSALYRAICFAAGERPDYALLRSIFAPDGRLGVPTDDGPVGITVLELDGFIELSQTAIDNGDFDERGFFETEIFRQTHATTQLAQVFSTYETRFAEDDPEPEARGVNSIQLVREGGRWWVVSMIWEDEGPMNQIGAEHLPQAG